MQTLANELAADGYVAELVLLSDVNATDMTAYADLPTFRDPTGGRTAWAEMEPGAVKHDTFVYDATGTRTLFWDTSENSLNAWAANIRAAVIAAQP